MRLLFTHRKKKKIKTKRQKTWTQQNAECKRSQSKEKTQAKSLYSFWVFWLDVDGTFHNTYIIYIMENIKDIEWFNVSVHCEGKKFRESKEAFFSKKVVPITIKQTPNIKDIELFNSTWMTLSTTHILYYGEYKSYWMIY